MWGQVLRLLHNSWQRLQVGRAEGVTAAAGGKFFACYMLVGGNLQVGHAEGVTLYSAAAGGKFFACYMLVGGTYR